MVDRESAGMLEGDDTLDRLAEGDSGGSAERLGTRGEPGTWPLGRTLDGVTVVDRSLRSPAADRTERSVVADLSVGVGEAASEREPVRECDTRSGTGDIGAVDDGGVGTTIRASWSRRIAISLLASGWVSIQAVSDEPTSHIVLETLAFLLHLLLLDNFLLQDRLLFNDAVVL